MSPADVYGFRTWHTDFLIGSDNIYATRISKHQYTTSFWAQGLSTFSFSNLIKWPKPRRIYRRERRKSFQQLNTKETWSRDICQFSLSFWSVGVFVCPGDLAVFNRNLQSRYRVRTFLILAWEHSELRCRFFCFI